MPGDVRPAPNTYARCDVYRFDCCVLRIVHCIRPFLQCHEVRQSAMDSWIILIISALTMVYLLYALLRPEKF